MEENIEIRSKEDLKLYENKNPLWKWKIAQSLENSGDRELASEVYKELAGKANPYRDRARQWLESYVK